MNSRSFLGRRSGRALAVRVAMTALATHFAAQSFGAEFPGPEWVTATPADIGLDPAKLDQAREYALTGAAVGSSRGGSAAAAAESVSPYPPSPVIRTIEWEPVASIARLAMGSDNWPVTWADDDAFLLIACGPGS